MIADGRRNDSSAEDRAIKAALRNRPDLGWAFAERIAGSRHPCPILKRREYRWVRAAKNLHTGGATAAKHLRDVEIVEQARELHDSDEIRPVLNALLMTRGATALSVADGVAASHSRIAEYLAGTGHWDLQPFSGPLAVTPCESPLVKRKRPDARQELF